jgi:hypothetical protein
MQTITESRKEIENAYYNLLYVSKELKSISEKAFDYTERVIETAKELLSCEDSKRIDELDDIISTRVNYLRTCVFTSINTVIGTMESYTEEKKTLVKRLRDIYGVLLEITIEINAYKSLKEKGK